MENNKPDDLTEEQKQAALKDFTEFTVQHILTFFKMMDLKTHIDCQLHNEPTDERFIFRFYKVGVGYESSEDTFAKAILKLESENKALREENTRLTTKFIEEEHASEFPNDHLSYWQYQQFTRAAITKLKEEISQLKAEVLKEKFPGN